MKASLELLLLTMPSLTAAHASQPLTSHPPALDACNNGCHQHQQPHLLPPLPWPPPSAGKDCYVEASSSNAAQLYARHGFNVVERFGLG